MQIETFKLFCDLVDTGSFSDTAERNQITQSAVSQRIKALEDQYQVLLIERGRKNFAVTAEGHALLSTARDMIDLYDSIDVNLRALQNKVEGALTISTVYSIGFHELPPVLEIYRKRFPDVTPHLQYRRANQVYADVLASKADVGLVAYPQARKGVEIEIVWKDKLVMICPAGHELAEHRTIELKQLDGQRFISFEPDLPTRKALDTMLQQAGVQVNEVMDFDNIETVKRGVQIEQAISIVPQDTVKAEIENGSLIQIDIEAIDVWRPLGVVRRRSKAITPAMREFITLLKQQGLGGNE
ncbi:MAG: LysR family transcriptional regulator [Verrucomicrobiales bacterium]|nr:LysR family transcriptional regulator [Verrucomicrobiales bacterium]